VCGIYGIVAPSGETLEHTEVAIAMGPSLRHRGPDGTGLLQRPDVIFGAERLRIVDPSPRADQPFADAASRIWLVANGEIYNAPELRRRFPTYPFRSTSDVEVVIPLYLACGIAGLADLEGMFALAVWDHAQRQLVLARDRAGEKPLFWAEVEGTVLFASEIQALLCHPRLPRAVDAMALGAFLGLGYVPTPRSMFEAIHQVPAGSAIVVDRRGCQTHCYWRPPQRPTVGQPPDPSRALQELLGAAVRRQLQADVPIGVFTSGGVDSSLIAAIAAKAAGPTEIRTFTARFTAPGYDESAFARLVAARLGTHHHEVVIDETGLNEALDVLTDRMAEPSSDPALLPTFLLARQARRHVSVVLGGEGADELFGGYPTYLGHTLVPLFARLPAFSRDGLRRFAQALPESTAKVPVSLLFRRFVAEAGRPWLKRHLAWFGTGLDLAQLLGQDTADLASLLAQPLEKTFAGESVASRGEKDALAATMFLDFTSYLPDQLLVKLDRATMLVALEARSPFLDREIMEFALRLDTRWKVHGLRTKPLLKNAARLWLPRRIVRRRKRGLSVPIATWLRGGLRPELRRVLDPVRLRRQGLLSDVYVGRLVAEHLGGRANHARALWTLIVLERWLERWTPEVGA
jgi:asparagine synthase (glutamine-hydrolysing)